MVKSDYQNERDVDFLSLENGVLKLRRWWCRERVFSQSANLLRSPCFLVKIPVKCAFPSAPSLRINHLMWHRIELIINLYIED